MAPPGRAPGIDRRRALGGSVAAPRQGRGRPLVEVSRAATILVARVPGPRARGIAIVTSHAAGSPLVAPNVTALAVAAASALPVADLAARPALMFMWTTTPMLRRAIVIPEAWGFRYVTELVWPKQRIGTNYWARGQHEPCLIYKRGRFPWPGRAPFASSLIRGVQREHSRKPDALQDAIDATWPDARKLEMFARRPREGWATWGNEVDGFPGVATG